jgi:DNA topoisomerase-1
MTGTAEDDDPESEPVALAGRLGLRHVDAGTLMIRRRRAGAGWCYLGPGNRVIRDATTVRRLSSLAVPPAYRHVRYATDPHAHLQARGRDAAGRLQYRYHAKWEQARELRKARQLARLAAALPRIRRSIRRHLAGVAPTREFAAAALIELVARSAIRPGRESYARLHRTRGAATLLKTNVRIAGDSIALAFRSKGGKLVVRKLHAPRLVCAIARLRRLPGMRLFQYRDRVGVVRPLLAREANDFLRRIAKANVSLKDFRTLFASMNVLEALATIAPAGNATRRRRQVREAVVATAEHLANTPAICERSYVHRTVLEAFENGQLGHLAAAIERGSAASKAAVLAKIVADGGGG